MKQSDYGVQILRNSSGDVDGVSLGVTYRAEHQSGIAGLIQSIEGARAGYYGSTHTPRLSGVMATKYKSRDWVNDAVISTARRRASHSAAADAEDLLLSFYSGPVKGHLPDIYCKIVGNERLAASWGDRQGFFIRARGNEEKAALCVIHEALLQKRLIAFQAPRAIGPRPMGFCLLISDKADLAAYGVDPNPMVRMRQYGEKSPIIVNFDDRLLPAA